MNARWLIGVVAIAMIIATVLLSRTSQTPDVTHVDRSSGQDPGYSARDAESIETGEDGRPRYWLRAEMIEQAPNDATITLTHPALRYLGEGGSSWRASALTGTVPPTRNLIMLDGDVRLDGTLRGGGAPAHVETSHLAFDTVNVVASTKARVAIDWSGHRLSARGLRADLKGETLRLESKVNGRFLPQ